MRNLTGLYLFFLVVAGIWLPAGYGQDYSVTPYCNLQMQSGGRMTVLEFSPDGQFLAGGTDHGAVTVWALENRTPIFELSEFGRVLLVDFLTGGQEIVVVDKKGRISGVNLLTRLKSFSFTSRSAPRVVALDNGKRFLALINRKQKVEIFDLVAKMPVGTIDGADELKHTVFLGFDRLGQQLVAITERGEVLVWNPATLRLLRKASLGGGELHGSRSLIHAASTNRSANVFIVGLEEVALPKGGLSGMARPGDLVRTQTIIAYDFNTGIEIKRIKFPYSAVSLIAMGPGNDHAAVVAKGATHIRLTDFRKGEFGATVSLEASPTAIAVSENDGYLAAGYADGIVAVWSLEFIGSRIATSEGEAALPTLGGRIRPTSQLSPALQPGSPVTMAILEFSSKGVGKDISSTCLEIMATGFANVPHITLVERSRIKDIIDELELSLTGLTESDGIRVGKMLNAGYVLLCSVGALGSSYVFNARLVNVETGVVEAGRGVICEECRDQDIFDAVNMLVQVLAQ